MRIVNLMEDTSGDNGCEYEHGLSIYVETDAHRIIVDTGASEKTWRNAERLGIDLTAIDSVILSHGHYDHSGGILSLMKYCPDAAVYMRENADGNFFSTNGNTHYIGIDRRISALPNLIRTGADYRIDDSVFLFSGVDGERLRSEGNRMLKVIRPDCNSDGRMECDDFSHEQNVVIREGDMSLLICGCAHRGILNILDKYRAHFGIHPDIVVGGFHMVSKSENYTQSELDTVIATARELSAMNTVFYTGHCTGMKAFDIMHEVMGDKLKYMHSGSIIL